MRLRVLLILVLVVGPAATTANAEAIPSPRPGAPHAVPLYGELVRVYDAPPDPYAPGHRGVDVAAPQGALVRASAVGVVSFAGNVAGNRTVTVDHGDGLLTTSSFLGTLFVTKGTAVEQGEPVGTVGLGHPGSSLPPHVHLSARRNGIYIDPMELYVGSGYSDLLSLTA